jgi:hypothetical protein
MVAAAADDGVAPAVADASAKLLASPEVDELEADYVKWGYCLATGLLGEGEGKIHGFLRGWGGGCYIKESVTCHRTGWVGV